MPKPQKAATRSLRRTTISDVAREAGVAIKTISRFLNNDASIKPSTRERVQKAVKALNYSPNPAARALAGTRSFLIGLLYNNPSAYYMDCVQEAILDVCRAHGYHLLVETCSADPTQMLHDVPSMIAQTRVDGVILTPTVSDNPLVLAALRRDRVPHVVIAPSPPQGRSLSVHMDHEGAAYEMATSLFNLGHRRIGFIKGHPQHSASRLRYQGFCRALIDRGIEPDLNLVAQGHFSFETGHACARTLLQAANRPTAIFAANDDMAAGCITAAHELGLGVPEDVSIAGFNDTPVALITWPTLTTVHQPIREMAAGAAKLLFGSIAAKARQAKSRSVSSEQFHHRIILRGSTSSPRN
ncbi:MAG TPA: LacI family DNA-binding transcriptional regulator [Steroidobacteraceae bacterium]